MRGQQRVEDVISGRQLVYQLLVKTIDDAERQALSWKPVLSNDPLFAASISLAMGTRGLEMLTQSTRYAKKRANL